MLSRELEHAYFHSEAQKLGKQVVAPVTYLTDLAVRICLCSLMTLNKAYMSFPIYSGIYILLYSLRVV